MFKFKQIIFPSTSCNFMVPLSRAQSVMKRKLLQNKIFNAITELQINVCVYSTMKPGVFYRVYGTIKSKSFVILTSSLLSS